MPYHLQQALYNDAFACSRGLYKQNEKDRTVLAELIHNHFTKRARKKNYHSITSEVHVLSHVIGVKHIKNLYIYSGKNIQKKLTVQNFLKITERTKKKLEECS